MARQRNLKFLLLPFLLLCGILLAALAWQLRRPMELVRFYDRQRQIFFYPEYSDQRDSYSLILPGFLDPQDLEIRHPWYLRTDPLPSDLNSPTEFSLHFPLGLQKSYSLEVRKGSVDYSIFLEGSGDLLSFLHEDKARKRQVLLNVYEDGQSQHRSTVSMYGHGNLTGTWVHPKRPYNLKFSSAVDLGPFQNCQKMVLCAEYLDATKLRVPLVFHGAELLEIPYGSPYEFADLYVNGRYLGLYAMTTKQAYRNDPAVSAVFEISSSTRGELHTTARGTQIRILAGDFRDILPKVEALEAALLAQDWETAAGYADFTGLARKYALDEWAGNMDLNYASQYYYLDEQGVITPMLPWDYEHTFRNWIAPYTPNPRGYLAVNIDDDAWYQLLLQSEDFRAAAIECLETEFNEAFFQDMDAFCRETRRYIESSRRNDLIRWRREEEPGFYTEISRYFRERKEFLLEYLKAPEDYCVLRFFTMNTYLEGYPLTQNRMMLVLPKGSTLETYRDNLLVSFSREREYLFFTEDGTPFDFATPLTRDLSLSAIDPELMEYYVPLE